MGKRKTSSTKQVAAKPVGASGRPSSLIDTRVIYCGDGTGPRPLALYIAQRCQGSGSGVSSSSKDRHASTAACIDYMLRRCVELARVLKKSGSFYYHCAWHLRYRNGRHTLRPR